MLAAAFLYIIVAEQMASASSAPDRMIVGIVTALAIGNAIVAVIVRTKLAKPAELALSTDPENAALQNRWRMGTIIAAAMGESIVLFGMVLRFLGADRANVAALYLIGVVVLVFAMPRKPQVAIPGMPPQP